MNWLAVAVGGAIGAMARFGISSWLSPGVGQFPTATFCANVVGCFSMGVFYVIIVDKHLLPISLRPLIMIGFLGALTTFSTFSIEALALWQTHKVVTAMSYVFSSVVASILAVWAGFTLTEKFIH